MRKEKPDSTAVAVIYPLALIGAFAGVIFCFGYIFQQSVPIFLRVGLGILIVSVFIVYYHDNVREK